MHSTLVRDIRHKLLGNSLIPPLREETTFPSFQSLGTPNLSKGCWNGLDKIIVKYILVQFRNLELISSIPADEQWLTERISLIMRTESIVFETLKKSLVPESGKLNGFQQ